MRSILFGLLLSLCCVADLPAQNLIDISKEPVASSSLIVVRTAKTDKAVKAIFWDVIDPNGRFLFSPKFVYRDNRTPDVIVIGGGDGEYQISLKVILEDGSALQEYAAVQRGGAAPLPPVPTPTPDDGSVTGPVRLLIIEESDDRGTLDAGQRSILFGPAVDGYMKTHGAKDSKGFLEFRLLDDDLSEADFTTENANIREAFAKARSNWQVKGLPYFIISNGKKGVEGPLPKGTDAEKTFLEMLKKFGGN